jgi:hypothetical protein
MHLKPFGVLREAQRHAALHFFLPIGRIHETLTTI